MCFHGVEFDGVETFRLKCFYGPDVGVVETFSHKCFHVGKFTHRRSSLPVVAAGCTSSRNARLTCGPALIGAPYP
jgi:hypothetical protein